jgi:hypothetical protein
MSVARLFISLWVVFSDFRIPKIIASFQKTRRRNQSAPKLSGAYIELAF